MLAEALGLRGGSYGRRVGGWGGGVEQRGLRATHRPAEDRRVLNAALAAAHYQAGR
jgi:hypothetical protein